MGRVYWVVPGAMPTIPGWAELGPDALTVGLSEFSQRIRRHPGELKNLLRNQAFIAGVGNAYSDEILHEAGLLPLRKRTTLKADDDGKLHAATGKALHSAIGDANPFDSRVEANINLMLLEPLSQLIAIQ